MSEKKSPRQRDPESTMFFLILVAIIVISALIAWPFAMWLGWGVWVLWGGFAIWPTIPAIFLSIEGVFGTRYE